MTARSDDYHAALGSAARRQVLDALLAAAEPLDAAAVAASLGLHVTTARFHLDQLAAAGLATRRTGIERRRGRPRILYSPGGPVRDEQSREQLIQVLARALAREDETGAESQHAGRRWAEDFDGVIADDPVRDLVGVLDRIGFEPVLVGEQIRLHACPFREAAREQPQVVCSVHRGLLDRLLEPTDTRSRLHPFAEPDLCLVDLESSGPAMSR
ncbi:MAG TPA: helix-turn-helix domain-containing protein [Microbacteriaceae bacterium]|nr:helix-turn-helix domain-containing protein [Microbacteriaceae bacterium]